MLGLVVQFSVVTLLGYLMMMMMSAFVERFISQIGDHLKLSLDITTTQVNAALHPSRVAKSSTSFGWGKGGKLLLPGGR